MKKDEKQKECIMCPGNPCDNCGLCNMCDLDPNKVCDNCMKCLDLADYNGVMVEPDKKKK